MRRRRLTVVAASLVLVVVAVWMWVVPRLVAARLDPLVRRHAGWSLVQVGRVGLSMEGPVLSGVVLRPPASLPLPPARSRIRLAWPDLWGDPQHGAGLQGSTRFDPGAELHWQIRPDRDHASLTLTTEKLALAYLAGVMPALPWHEPRQAMMDLDLAITVPTGSGGSRPWPVQGDIHLSNLGLSSPLLADRPVTVISMDIRVDGIWHPAEGRLGPFRSQVALPGMRVELAGEHMRWGRDGYHLQGQVTLPTTGCAELLMAVPADLVGQTADFQLSGSVSGTSAFQVESHRLEETRLDVEVDDRCVIEAVPSVAAGIGQPNFRYNIPDAEGRLRWRTTGPGTPGWRPLAGISSQAVNAVLIQEDAGFYRHHGFSLPAIRESLVMDLEAGGTRRGASTLTMQLARNLFLPRHKTLARKLQEVIYAWWLERTLEKQAILETYLNVVEFGPRLHGIDAAAHEYFGCDAGQLTVAQGAFLASVLQAPYRAYEEVAAAGALSPQLSGRVRGLLQRMARAGKLDDEGLQQALDELAIMKPQVTAGGSL